MLTMPNIGLSTTTKDQDEGNSALSPGCWLVIVLMSAYCSVDDNYQ